MPTDKAQLHLASGKNAQDVAALAKLFKKLTGRDPTPAELDDARQQIQNAKG